MDHSDQIKQNLEILGMDCLDHLSLEQLSDAISKNLPSGLSGNRILNIYTMWLHSRLMVIDVSADDAVLKEMAAWCDYLATLGMEDWAISDAFDSWQRGEAIANPTSSRRLSIAGAELLRLIPPSSTFSDSSFDSRESEDSFSQMHPDRLKLSRGACEVIELSDDDEDEVLVKEKNPHRPSGDHGQASLPFLTGSNMLALNDKPRGRARDEGSRISRQQGTPSPPGYLCNRCGLKGHDIRECPTNLDPTFDKSPPSDYKCHFCKATGLHYGPLCPKHPDKNSIMRQRRRLAEELGWTDRYRPDRSEGNTSDSRSRQQRADRWSPARGARDKPAVDRFRPQDEPTRRRTSRSRGHEGKRRVSRSPSPDGKPRRQTKKQKTWLKKGERHWVVAKPAGPREDEGRLSYEDEVDDAPQPTQPASHVSGSVGEGKVEVDGLERFAFNNAKGVAAVVKNEWMESEISEMIRIESTRTDLLPATDGVEHLPCCEPAVVKLFEGHETIFINEALGKTRPRPTDFYELRDEGEPGVDEIDCGGVHENPAATEAEVCPAPVDGLASPPDPKGGDDSGMGGAEPTPAATPAREAGLAILARACLHVEAASPSQTKAEGVGIKAIPYQLDDKLPVEGVTEPVVPEERDVAPETNITSFDVGPLVVSHQDTSYFSASQSHGDMTVEAEKCAGPASVPVDDTPAADMTGPKTLPVAGETTDSNSASCEISPMTIAAQSSPCPGLTDGTTNSETTSSESSPAGAEPTTPYQILGAAPGSETAVCGVLAEAEDPEFAQQALAHEMPKPEDVTLGLSPALKMAVCETPCFKAPASFNTACPGTTPAAPGPTAPCQVLAGEVLDSEKSDDEISSMAKAVAPRCKGLAEETSVAQSDAAVDHLLVIINAALAKQEPPVSRPSQDEEFFTAAQVVLAEEASAPISGQEAESSQAFQAALAKEGPVPGVSQGTGSPHAVEGALTEGSSQGDEPQAKAASDPDDGQASVG